MIREQLENYEINRFLLLNEWKNKRNNILNRDKENPVIELALMEVLDDQGEYDVKIFSTMHLGNQIYSNRKNMIGLMFLDRDGETIYEFEYLPPSDYHLIKKEIEECNE